MSSTRTIEPQDPTRTVCRPVLIDARYRELLLLMVGMLIATVAWMIAMFLTRRPAIDDFCVLGFTPFILAILWFSLGWNLLTLMWQHRTPTRLWLIALVVMAFLLAPYSFFRAGRDMFSLSVRYHLWRAGGAEKVQSAFNQWVAAQPLVEKGNGEKDLFHQQKPDGSMEPISLEQMPAEVRYIHEKYPSRFGTSWNDVARIDNVTVLTMANILIGPPGWQPEGNVTFWDQLTGSRRKLADGIWVTFRTYDK